MMHKKEMKALLHSQVGNERGQQFDFLRCCAKWRWLGKCVPYKVSIKSLSSHHHQYGRKVWLETNEKRIEYARLQIHSV